MKKSLLLGLLMITALCVLGQSNFSLQDYKTRLESNADLNESALIQRYNIPQDYYSIDASDFDIMQSKYADSVVQALNLTDDELTKLKANHFVVTERLSYPHFSDAYTAFYTKDLPVFITSDAILHALHCSYDDMLKSIEQNKLLPNLTTAINQLANDFDVNAPAYVAQGLTLNVQDTELYIKVAQQLLNPDASISLTYVAEQDFNRVMNAISDEQYASFPLFTYANRSIDYSQFTVRGHYKDEADLYGLVTPSLEPYFRCVMWLGFIDFMLTKPEQDPTYTAMDIDRMTITAAIVNELYQKNARQLMQQNEDVIRFFVGESDNLAPDELTSAMQNVGLSSAEALLDSTNRSSLREELKSADAYQQKILSSLIISDPLAPETAELPISFKLFGQRYVVDSHVLSNVVFDRVKTLPSRMMPNPLDAMFALGNNHALPLLKNEFATYDYFTELDAMRYLMDQFDEDYWQSTLYGSWIQSIRALGSEPEDATLPYFMKTTAWHHKQLNSQLASWTQLRHDNLLYAKQSYTAMAGCSYPDGYVEPYPDLYHGIKVFAQKAAEKLGSGLFDENTVYQKFWQKFAEVADTLEQISLVELAGEPLNAGQLGFVQSMLKVVFPVEQMCGAEPVYNGWYPKLFYEADTVYGSSKFDKADIIVADVHTQPTDEAGNMVGKVLHVGIGRVNGAVFIGPSNDTEGNPIMYVGACMSYYEQITDDFERLTDQDWESEVGNYHTPDRPDWTHIYLTNRAGAATESELEIQGVPNYNAAYQVGVKDVEKESSDLSVYYRNGLWLKFDAIPQAGSQIDIYGASGKRISSERVFIGNQDVLLGYSPETQGVYIIKVTTSKKIFSQTYLHL